MACSLRYLFADRSRFFPLATGLLGLCLAWGAAGLRAEENGAAADVPEEALEEPGFRFVQMPIDPDLRRNRLAIDRLLRGFTDSLDGNEEMFDAYFTRYELPRFTQEDELDNLPNLRADLKSRSRMAARNPNIRTRLNHLIRDYMFRVAGNARIHPAARVNAVLAIGDLDDPQAPRTASSPWMPALEPLMMIVRAENAPDAVRVAALVGVRRHAKVPGRAESSRQAIAAPMVQLANRKEAPSTRTEEGHIWVRRMALEVLADLRWPGEENAILDNLVQMAGDTSEPLEIRCAAVETIAALPLEQLQIDPIRLAAMMGRIGIDAVRLELEANESAHGYSPRRLVARLTSLETGFLALAGKGNNAQQEFVKLMDQYVATMKRNALDLEKSEAEQRELLDRLATRLTGELDRRGLRPAATGPEPPPEPQPDDIPLPF